MCSVYPGGVLGVILSVRNTRCRTDERRNTHAQRHLELTRAAVTRGLDSIRILKFFFFFFLSSLLDCHDRL